MKQIGLCNINNVLSDALSDKYDIIKISNNNTYVENIIIDWIPNIHEKNKASQLILQVSLIEKYAKNKKVNIIVFDRYLSITEDECKWLKQNGVVLLEPALNYRHDFNYLPAWIKPKTGDDITLDAPEKKYDIVYNGSPGDNILDFEKYLLTYCKEASSNRNVCYSKSINDTKTNEYKDCGLIQSIFDYSDSKFALLLGTPHDYRIGYLHPDLPKMLESNCIPLIPTEHRYYNAMSLVIGGAIDMIMFAQTYNKLYYGYLLDIYSYIEEFYPEMLVENTANMLEQYIK